MIPKSGKLAKEEAERSTIVPSFANDNHAPANTGPIQIRIVPCCNEYVAVLRFLHESTIALPDEQKHKNEGIVVGIGPGLPNATDRCPSQLAVGDVVMFRARDVITEVQSAQPPYKDKNIVILSERNIMCKLPPVEYEVLQ